VSSELERPFAANLKTASGGLGIMSIENMVSGGVVTGLKTGFIGGAFGAIVGLCLDCLTQNYAHFFPLNAICGATPSAIAGVLIGGYYGYKDRFDGEDYELGANIGLGLIASPATGLVVGGLSWLFGGRLCVSEVHLPCFTIVTHLPCVWHGLLAGHVAFAICLALRPESGVPRELRGHGNSETQETEHGADDPGPVGDEGTYAD
jgi:hypothetical protein